MNKKFTKETLKSFSWSDNLGLYDSYYVNLIIYATCIFALNTLFTIISWYVIIINT